MSRRNRPSAQRQTRKRKIPLTERVDAALKKGPGTTDAIARRVREPAPAVGKALSKRKQQGKAYFQVLNGEAVWRRGAPRLRAPRKT